MDFLNCLSEHLSPDATNFHLVTKRSSMFEHVNTFSSFRNWLAVLQKSWMVLSLSTKLSKRWKTSCSLKSHDLQTFLSSLSSLSFSFSLSFSSSSFLLSFSSSSLKYVGHLALYSWSIHFHLDGIVPLEIHLKLVFELFQRLQRSFHFVQRLLHLIKWKQYDRKTNISQ